MQYRKFSRQSHRLRKFTEKQKARINRAFSINQIDYSVTVSAETSGRSTNSM